MTYCIRLSERHLRNSLLREDYRHNLTCVLYFKHKSPINDTHITQTKAAHQTELRTVRPGMESRQTRNKFLGLRSFNLICGYQYFGGICCLRLQRKSLTYPEDRGSSYSWTGGTHTHTHTHIYIYIYMRYNYTIWQ
jgi:hypothetical protein